MAEVVRAYIALGSNLQNPQQQVRDALRELASLPGTRWVAQSSLYRTAPMGPQDQPEYINAVAALDTTLAAFELLDSLLAIERRHGRVRGEVRWGPRTLDLDLLLYGECRISGPRLTVPHPGLAERPFVLYPLSEIAADLAVPGKGRLRDLLASCPAAGIERIVHDG